MKKKRLWYILAVLGLLTVFFSATASDGGAGLQYTIPPAIIGCVMLWAGIMESRKIEQQEHRERQVAARRKSLKLIQQRKESERNESVL